ncbi:inactive peptidyl-prolyl cis-trans isomerase FKBP6-like [Branchiostoma floridae x Branchiostoma belcheri]
MAERAPIPAEEYERQCGQTNDSSSEFESCAEDAGFSGDDAPTTRLVSGLNLKEVCDTTGQGAEFEVESQLQMEEAALDNRYFDAEDVFQQLSRAPLDDESEDSSTEDLDMSPFERLAVKMEDISGGDRGVVKKVLKQGVGDVVPAGAYVRVHYNGYLEYSDEPFDSSRLRNEELRFRLATGSVVPGMEIAISSMKKGERSRFLVQPNYGYGKFGCPPRIPGNATVLYEIEMLNFVDRSTAEEFNSLTEDQKKEATFQQLLEVAHVEKNHGNEYFQRHQFKQAISKYSKALRTLENARLANDEEEAKRNKVLLKLYNNMALCNLKVGEYARCIANCNRALEIDGGNVKALYRKGQALCELSEFDRSKGCLLKAQNLAPNNKDIREELKKLDRKFRQFSMLEKECCRKMFGGLKGTQEIKSSDIPECSAEFKKLIDDKFVSFCEDAGLPEMTFPLEKLTSAERDCIQHTALGLGLEVTTRQMGADKQLRVRKKTSGGA